MRLPYANFLLACMLGFCSICLAGRAGLLRASGGHVLPANQRVKITVDYPLDGSVFPPEITPPTFLWRDASETAKRWVVEVSFVGHSSGIRVEVPGEHLRVGEIDPQAGPGDDLLQPTPEQAATRTWKPDAGIWEKIKRSSVKSPTTITITGFAFNDLKLPVSGGSVMISVSPDPVGAPVFYRDVPLMLSPRSENGSIQPLPPSAIPLIKWKLRNIGEPQSRTVMENLPTCANCHSFSLDGKTLGMDLDGSRNDKGLYALLPVTKNMTIRNQDVIRWSSFQEGPEASSYEPAAKRYGVMSQVSPDGRYVVTSIAPPTTGNNPQNDFSFGPGLSDRLFVMNYKDVRFTQVFYPTRGILVWYDRKEGKLRHLPGADDPRFVHTNAFWSPDGKYLIFSRAEARDPYPPGARKPEYANDPNETQIQYDLYRISFNDGRGGKAEPVAGASGNGMSNNFPKVSPDGRWIVFVQNRNGLLMRPDSKLYIVPFAGGQARLMKCNTSLMNSWHTFSPNGRWLAFSSKARSPYTRLMLTHIDADGNDTPAIIVDNTTAANRAVNIPEFVNVPQDGLDRIDPQATKFFRLFNQAYELMQNKHMAEAIPVLHDALQEDPDDALAHYALGAALAGNSQEREAVEEYLKACALNSHNAAWLARLAGLQALTGDPDGAVVNWRKSLTLDPSNAVVETDLGTVLFENGQAREGYEDLQKAVDMAPDLPNGHDHLGLALAKMGRLDEAVDQMQRAVALLPTSVKYRADLEYVRGLRGDSVGSENVQAETAANIYKNAVAAYERGDISQAIRLYEELLSIQPESVQARTNLAVALVRDGRYSEAIAQYNEALKRDPGNPILRINLALAWYKQADFEKAAVELENLRRKTPENKQSLYLLADCYLRLGRNGDAVRLLEPSYQANPDDQAVDYALGTALIRDGKSQQGEAVIDHIMKGGNTAAANLLIGSAQLEAGDHGAAKVTLRKALDLDPSLPGGWSLYGRALLDDQDTEAAKSALKRAVDADPNDFDANLYLGGTLRHEGNLAEAAPYLEKALRLHPDSVPARYQVGALNAASGKLTEALEDLLRVARQRPDFVQVHVLLASVYQRLNRSEDSQRERDIVLKLNASEREAQTKPAP